MKDPGFSHHGSVSFSASGQGLTTIMQWLVNLLNFEKSQLDIAKIRQTLVAAYALAPLVNKDEQLRMLINPIGLDEGVRGFAESARHYFYKDFRKLDETQYLTLIAMILSPENFSLSRHPERNQERVGRINKLRFFVVNCGI
ncbi:hypothetical protein DFAR_400004 [Desulfarculales bacterium]